MKFDSPLFDRIRVKPDQDRRLHSDKPACEWPGCACAATHRAPKGRLREGEYWRFCLEHVREYNQSYNYFAGMSDEAVAKYPEGCRHRTSADLEARAQRQAAGRRPGWRRPIPSRFRRDGRPVRRVHRFWRPELRRARDRRAEGRMVRNAERKALDALGLEGDADGAGHQGALQAPGEAPSSRRQRRRPHLRGQAARDHPGLQLFEVARFC